jgi:hypothetical protein
MLHETTPRPDANAPRLDTANSPRPAALDGQTFAIGVLALSACVLFVGFMLLVRQPALAVGQADRAGDYKMLTQHVATNRELLLVLDAAAKQMITYEFDISQKKLEIVALLPLDQMPQPADGNVAPPPQNPPRRRP